MFDIDDSVCVCSIVGFLKDYTRKYDTAFVVGGAMIIIAAFFHFAISFVQPEKNTQEKKKANEEKDLVWCFLLSSLWPISEVSPARWCSCLGLVLSCLLMISNASFAQFIFLFCT